MGRDTTASKRMAAKRSREREAGLRRLNVALRPEVFDKLTVLMKQHNCTSQAALIELLVLDIAKETESRKAKDRRNAVTDKKTSTKYKAWIEQQQKAQKKKSAAKLSKDKPKVVTALKDALPAQMSLF